MNFLPFSFRLHSSIKIQTKIQCLFKFICRPQYTHIDLRKELINNWNHFYWLTGEVPPTFNLLLDEIATNLPRKCVGQNPVLNIENQVRSC